MYKKILVIIQRSNGDVLLSAPLVEALHDAYPGCTIDLLVNADTIGVARLLPHIRHIRTYDYTWKKKGFRERAVQELGLIRTIWRKYDLSISLTASDRSVMYAILSGGTTVCATEKKASKAWWKQRFANHTYLFDEQKHILMNNTEPLALLDVKHPDNIQLRLNTPEAALERIGSRLKKKGITRFLLFHPSAQYLYKVYPEALRNALLELLGDLDIPVIVTGAKSEIDLQIKASLPKWEHIHDWIGETTLEEYVALSSLSLGYIGMDTLNMHIAAAQNKRIFAIFGPTLLPMWSPWSNALQQQATDNIPVQTYGNVTLFQADMPCVACGLAGCDDKGGKSDCLERIDPHMIFKEISQWLTR